MLKLIGIPIVTLGSVSINQQKLETGAEDWQNGIDLLTIDDATLFRVLASQSIPLTLCGDANTVLKVEIARFPYSVDGKRQYQAVSCRFVPETGRLSEVVVHHGLSVAINAQTITQQWAKFEVGNGSLRLEVYFEPPTKDLEPLRPPLGFKPEVWLD